MGTTDDGPRGARHFSLFQGCSQKPTTEGEPTTHWDACITELTRAVVTHGVTATYHYVVPGPQTINHNSSTRSGKPPYLLATVPTWRRPCTLSAKMPSVSSQATTTHTSSIRPGIVACRKQIKKGNAHLAVTQIHQTTIWRKRLAFPNARSIGIPAFSISGILSVTFWPGNAPPHTRGDGGGFRWTTVGGRNGRVGEPFPFTVGGARHPSR